MRTWDEYKKTIRTEQTLWTAAKAGDLQSIDDLIRQGFEINQKDHRGYSPLMLAVYSGQIDAARLLLQLGADPNSSDSADNTILMGAAFKGHDELVLILLLAGADPIARNTTGMTAADFAQTFGRSSTLQILEQRGSHSSGNGRLSNLFRILTNYFYRRTPTEI